MSAPSPDDYMSMASEGASQQFRAGIVPLVKGVPSALRLLRDLPALHRWTPLMTGVWFARRRAERWWAADPTLREFARLEAGATFAAPDVDVETLAKKYVFESFKREELQWRRWLTTRMTVDRLSVLANARARGGVILSFMHHGQYGGTFASLARAGFPCHIATHPWFFGPKVRGTNNRARYTREHLATISSCGGTVFNAAGSFDRMSNLLASGEIVAIASDVPGNTISSFLGRRVGAASGAARLAIATGAPIVPVMAVKRGDFQSLSIGDPIDAVNGADYVSVLDEIFLRHGPAVAAWPEALERPLWTFRPVAGKAVGEIPDLSRFHRYFPL